MSKHQVSGDWTKEAYEAVRMLQEIAGINIDGKAGHQTWDALQVIELLVKNHRGPEDLSIHHAANAIIAGLTVDGFANDEDAARVIATQRDSIINVLTTLSATTITISEPTPAEPEHRQLSEREHFMVEAAMYHGFEIANDDATMFLVSQEAIVKLMQNYESPDQGVLSKLKINDWINEEIEKIVWPHGDGTLVSKRGAIEAAQGAALQIVFDKATLIDNLVNNIHANNVRAGWWNDLKTGEDLHGKRNVGELLALVHSEISEAIEAQDDDIEPLMNIQMLLLHALSKSMNRKQALLDINVHVSRALEFFRKGGKADDKLTNRPGFRVELLDAVIRIFDVLGSDRTAQREHPAGAIFIEKLAYNHARLDHKREHRRGEGGKSI